MTNIEGKIWECPRYQSKSSLNYRPATRVEQIINISNIDDFPKGSEFVIINSRKADFWCSLCLAIFTKTDKIEIFPIKIIIPKNSLVQFKR